MHSKQWIISIDIGTCNTVCYYSKGGKGIHLQYSEREDHVPTTIATMDGEVVFGNGSVRPERKKNELFIDNIKSILGLRSKDGKGYSGRITPYGLSEDLFPRMTFINPRVFISPQYALALFLWNLRQQEQLRRRKNYDIILTVPALTDASQLHAYKEAAELAGFHLIGFVPEPIAAAISIKQQEAEFHHLLVYDLGGGTCDVSLLEKNNQEEYTIITSQQHPTLGGLQFDYCLLEYVYKCIGRIK